MVAFYKTKGWYKSKTVWSGIGTAVLGVLALFDVGITGAEMNMAIEAAFTFLGLFTIYGRVTATEAISSSPA